MVQLMRGELDQAFTPKARIVAGMHYLNRRLQ